MRMFSLYLYSPRVLKSSKEWPKDACAYRDWRIILDYLSTTWNETYSLILINTYRIQ